MTITLLALLLTTAMYVGFQLTVQLVVYRQFELVPAAAFVTFERSHQRRISYLVGPLFAAQVLSTAALLLFGAPDMVWLGWLSGALLVTVLAITALAAVPLHRTLTDGFDSGAYRKLLRVDLIRTVLAGVNLAAVVMLILVQS